MGLQETYNKLYKESDYNEPEITGNEKKFSAIRQYIGAPGVATAVDLGCGRGYYLKKMKAMNIDAYGVEFSDECCTKHLSGEKVFNTDIQSHCLSGDRKVDLALCMDVMEHVPEEDVPFTIQAISKTSNYAVFGIANHPDIQSGVELHVTRHNYFWWKNILMRWYDSVEIIDTEFQDFFIAICKRSIRVLIVHPSRGRATQAATAFQQHVSSKKYLDTKVKYVFSLDLDDTKDRYNTNLFYPGVEVAFNFAKNSGCVQATNRIYDKDLIMWSDFIILTSDDMELCKDWDVVLHNKFSSVGFDKCIKTKQPGGRDDVLTLQIAGWKMFLDYGTFFWPEYVSIWADSDLTGWAQANKRWVVDSSIVCIHNHPYAHQKNSFQFDDTYAAENNPGRHAQGEALYNLRKSEGFPPYSGKNKASIETVYPFQYSEIDINGALARISCSINSLRGQPCRYIITNASERCVAYELVRRIDTEFLYIHRPCASVRHKTKIHNYTIKNWCFGKYVFQTDVDIIYPPRVIEDIMSGIEGGTQRVLLMCQYLNIKTPTADYKALFDQREKLKSDPPYPSHGIGLVHRETFLKIGGYDEKFIGWGPEDRELTSRLKYFSEIITKNEILTFHTSHPLNRLNSEKNKTYGYQRIGEITDVCKNLEPDGVLRMVLVNGWRMGEWEVLRVERYNENPATVAKSGVGKNEWGVDLKLAQQLERGLPLNWGPEHPRWNHKGHGAQRNAYLAIRGKYPIVINKGDK